MTNRSAIAHTDYTLFSEPDLTRRWGGGTSDIIDGPNLFTPNLGDTVRMIDGAGQANLQFDIDNIFRNTPAKCAFPPPAAADYTSGTIEMIGIMGVCVTEAAADTTNRMRVRVRGASTDVWNAGSITYNSDWRFFYDTRGDGKFNIIIPVFRNPQPPEFRSMRIQMQYFGNASGGQPHVVEIGHLFLGRVFRPQHPIRFDPASSARFTNIESVSRGGSIYSTELFRRRSFRCSFPCLSIYEAFGNPYEPGENVFIEAGTNTGGTQTVGAQDDNNLDAIQAYNGNTRPVIIFPEYPDTQFNSLIFDTTAVESRYTPAWNVAALRSLYGRVSNWGEIRRTYNADELMSAYSPTTPEFEPTLKEHNYSASLTVEEYL